MAVYIKGKNGKLSDALAGLQAGLVQGFGMGQQARRTALAERDQAAQEQRYRQQVEHANRLYELDVAQSRRADEDQAAQRQREADTRESTAALGEYATQEPITKEFGQGAGVFADLQAAQDAELARTAGIAKRITTPEAQRMFIQEQRAKMEDQQNQALIEHNKTRLERLGASPLHSEGGELGHKGEARAARLKELSDILEQATTPEARAKALSLVGNALQTQIMDDAVEADRLRTVARTAQAAQQDMATMEQVVAQNRAAGVAPEVLADMEASLGAMGTTLAFYEASGGEMTPQQFSQAWQMARRARAPRPAAESGPKEPDPMKAKELDTRIRTAAATAAQKEYAALIKGGLKVGDPNLPTIEALTAKHYLWLGGVGDNAPPEQTTPATPEEVKTDGALGKSLFNPDAYKSEIQQLLDGGEGRKARELFKKAKLGPQFDQTSRPSNPDDAIPTDSKRLMRARRQ